MFITEPKHTLQFSFLIQSPKNSQNCLLFTGNTKLYLSDMFIRKWNIIHAIVWEIAREIVEIICEIAMWNFERASIYAFMLCNFSSMLTGCLFNPS
ncbi:hypothetical protein HZS_5329 [Henneguya salminicola]|nr:hypothetical protein HZS_5329 [Henneguya salminicola]